MRSSLRALFGALVAFLLLPQSVTAAIVTKQSSYAPDAVIVTVKASPNWEAALPRLAGLLGARVDGVIEPLRAVRFRLPTALDATRMTALLDRVKAMEGVQTAELDFYEQLNAGPNDPYVTGGAQWAYAQIQADQAFDAWLRGEITFYRQVVIAVIDSGVNCNHQEMSGRCVPGYNFILNSTNPADDNGHGTFCAGLAAGSANNGLGMAGVAFTNAKIMPLKTFNSSGTSSSFDNATAIRWATDRGANVINMSFGSNNKTTHAAQAVQYALDRGVVLVAAAGNDNSSAAHYPSDYDGVIAVGAISKTGARASYSNFQPGIEIGAPGGNATCNHSGCDGVNCANSELLGPCYSNAAGYFAAAGTSFACPMVAGAVALLLASNSQLSATSIAAALQEKGDSVAAPWKRLNVYSSLLAKQVVPAQQDKLVTFANPFSLKRKRPLSLRFPPTAEAATFDVYDAGYRRVSSRSLDRAQAAVGLADVDLVDDRSDPLVPGSYYGVLKMGTKALRSKFTVIP